MIDLAILIPTMPSRRILLQRLLAELDKQIEWRNVKYLIHETLPFDKEKGTNSHGAKRNYLVRQAVSIGANSVAFVDDDDLIGPTYIQRGLEFVQSSCDVAELWGQIYFKGVPGNPFHHSLIHKEWWQDKNYYYRMPNHLNFQRLDLMKKVPFLDQGFGEDGKQSYAMMDAGIFKTEFKIPEIIYHYLA